MILAPLAEYLLSYRTPTGRQLARLGVIQTTVDSFPPGTTITWDVFPEFGSFCNIEIYYRVSPSMVPDAFIFDIIHQGTEIQAGTAGASIFAQGYTTWIVVTRANPLRISVTNISGLNQYLQNSEMFLIIDNQEDYRAVLELAKAWGRAPDYDVLYNKAYIGD